MTQKEVIKMAKQALLPYYVDSGEPCNLMALERFALLVAQHKSEWVSLNQKEMLAIIDQQQANKSTGLPMFYRDQCMDIARAIEAKLKEKNNG